MFWYGCALDECDEISARQLGVTEQQGHPCDPQCPHRLTAAVDCVWCKHCEKRREPQYPSGKKKNAIPDSGRFCLLHQRVVEVFWWKDGDEIKWHGTVPCAQFEKEGPGHKMAVEEEASSPKSEAW